MMATGSGPGPGSSGDSDTPVHTTDESLRLRNAIDHEFSHTVKVGNVLSLFRQTMNKEKVLTDNDIEKVEAVEKYHGDIRAASELLSCLKNYRPNWFTLLQQVLRHEDVNLKHLANTLDKCYDEELGLGKTVAHYQHDGAHDHNRFSQRDSRISQGPTQQLLGNLNQNCPMRVMSVEIDTKDDFELKADKDVSDEDIECDGSTMTGPDMSKSSLLSDMPKPNPTYSDKTKRNGLDPLPTLPTSQVEETMRKTVQAHEYDEIEGSSDGYEKCHIKETNESRVQHRKELRSGDKNKDMKDFTFAETEGALSGFDGWHQHQTDRGVIMSFSEILKTRENGHYLIWFWERKKRPAICVSHNGKLITFVIHRRLDRSNPNEDKHIYYISRDICLSTLKGLVEHHKREGLPNADSTIQLTHPIFPPE